MKLLLLIILISYSNSEKTVSQKHSLNKELRSNFVDGIPPIYSESYNDDYEFHLNYLLDSALTIGESSSEKIHYYNYINDKMNSEIVKVKIGDTLVNSERINYIYSQEGKLTSKLSEKWFNNSWTNNSRNTYTYDINNRTKLFINETWSNESWISKKRKIYTYNNAGKMLTYLRQERKTTYWQDEIKETFTYDSNNTVIEFLKENLQTPGNFNDLRITYKYNNDERIKTEYLEIVDSIWRPNLLFTKSYNSRGNLILTIVSSWQDSIFIDGWRDSYLYNLDGKLESKLYERYYNEQWNNEKEYIYKYDESGNNIEYLEKQWNINKWNNYSRYSIYYSLTNDIISFKKELYQNGAWNLWMDTWNLTDNYNNSYSFSRSQVKLFYKKLPTSLETEKYSKTNLQLNQNYPNPFNSSTTIKYILPKNGYIELSIFNILGVKVATIVNEYQTIGEYEVKFDCSTLSSGIYFYKIENGNFSETKKLILLK